MKSLLVRISVLAALFAASTNSARCELLSYSPGTGTTGADLTGTLPIAKFGATPLPQGEAQFADGLLALRIMPEYNFDKVAVLEGPIIHSEIASTGTEAIVTGIAYFRRGYWIDKLPIGKDTESIKTTSDIFTGNVTAIDGNSITINTRKGDVTVRWSEIKEIHSPRAFAFAVPALAPGPVGTDQPWNVNARGMTLTSSSATPLLAAGAMKKDPLLRGDGDWSTKKLVMLGTALSLIEIAQFTPELVVALNRNHLLRVANLRELQSGGFVNGLGVPIPQQ